MPRHQKRKQPIVSKAMDNYQHILDVNKYLDRSSYYHNHTVEQYERICRIVNIFSTKLKALAQEDVVRDMVDKSARYWKSNMITHSMLLEKLEKKITPNLTERIESGEVLLNSTIDNMARLIGEIIDLERDSMGVRERAPYVVFTSDDENGAPIPELNSLCIRAEALKAQGIGAKDDDLKCLASDLYAFAQTVVEKDDLRLPKRTWNLNTFRGTEFQTLADLRPDLILFRQRANRVAWI